MSGGFFIRDLLNLTGNNNQQGGQEENGTSSSEDGSQDSGRETPRRLVGLFLLTSSDLFRHNTFLTLTLISFYFITHLTSHYFFTQTS
jgi:hypothetical protein